MADGVETAEVCEQFCTEPSRTNGLRDSLEDRDVNGMVQMFKALSIRIG
ncbi:hypothetical protein HMSSN139_64670 [Paenibacillus sp. HMSSN-139]|nr:hypothetical protein HMSSN139_64670 [Paenibacillus sp. HMSSN-139]